MMRRAIRPVGMSCGFYLLSALFGLGITGLALTIWMVHVDARRQIEDLGTANSDSTQWFLAQTEVEIMALHLAVIDLQNAPDRPGGATDVRRRFDIFYSRMTTLHEGTTFAALRDSPEIRPAMQALRDGLDRLVPVIDGPDAGLLAALPVLRARSAAAVPLVRRISLEGVRLFALDSDLRRKDVAAALNHLSLLVVPLFLVLFGTLGGLLVMFRAARIQTQQVAKARNRLQSLFDASIDAILVAHPDGRILDYNAAAQQIYGYDPDTAIGGDVVRLLTPHDRRPAVRALLAEIRAGRRSPSAGRSEIIQTTARHKSGRIVPVELSLAVTADARDPLLVAFVRDVSRRAADEAELIEARDRALAGQQAKAHMIAVMSHEMRTPLNGILGTLELLQATPLDDRQARYLRAMDHSGRMLLQHVNDVLDASRAGRDLTPLATAPVDLPGLLAGVVDSLRHQAEAQGNLLTLDCHGATDRLVMGDRARLEQIAVNLIGNAIKFTQGGRIEVELDLDAGPDRVELRVSDTGIGMAEPDLERIFEAFVTLGPAFDRKVQGTGLGLSIVKGLVDAMGGTIDVASEPGLGSAFVVGLDLPAAGAPPQPAPPPAAGPSPSASFDLAILLVEDNEINRMVARELLQQHGCTVSEARDGLEGVAVAGDRRFDLILMDISMPGLNGVEATRRIRASGPNRGTPVVALTAHAMDQDLEAFTAAGMDRVLVKPLRRADLVGVLRDTHGRDRIPAGSAPDDLTATLGAARAEALIARIVAELRADLATLGQGLADQAAASVIHRMAGSAAIGGLTDLRRLLTGLETRLRIQGGRVSADEIGQMMKMLSNMSTPEPGKSGKQM